MCLIFDSCFELSFKVEFDGIMFSGLECSWYDLVYKGQGYYYWKDSWWKLVSIEYFELWMLCFYKIYNEFSYCLMIDIDEW